MTKIEYKANPALKRIIQNTVNHNQKLISVSGQVVPKIMDKEEMRKLDERKSKILKNAKSARDFMSSSSDSGDD